jgi:hypothetical protein
MFLSRQKLYENPGSKKKFELSFIILFFLAHVYKNNYHIYFFFVLVYLLDLKPH